MGYRLGVDLGTTYTSASVLTGQWPSMVGLGNRAMQIPSVVFIQPDGRYLVGEAAERRGADAPDRLAREFKRRLGDEVPLLVGGSPHSPQSLMAKLLATVVAVVTERQGEPPRHITLTHPANWGPFKRELFTQAIRLADLDGVETCTEPEAVAVLYASRNVLHEGDTIVVYDLGGGTFDAAVLRKTSGGFTLLGSPEGIEHLGGMDFDEAVYQHVLAALGDRIESLPSTKEVMRGLARLRHECVDVKEALSSDTEAAVAVNLPGIDALIRLTRPELEEMIRPALADTIGAVRRALRSAGVKPEDLTAIVLSGGSSRIPLVSEVLAEQFDLPQALDTHPKHDVAQGATLWRPELNARLGLSAPSEEGLQRRRPSGPSRAARGSATAEGPGPVPVSPVDRPPSRPSAPRRRPSIELPPAVSQVSGVRCSRGHLNDPRVSRCAVCGAPLASDARGLSNDERPALGSIVLDNGTTLPLDGDYLLGRDPARDGLVRSGQYRPLVLNDAQNMVSRAHARLELRNWDVVLVDNASTNGTFFAEPTSRTWKRLPRSGAQLLSPGTRIRVGNRTLFVYGRHSA